MGDLLGSFPKCARVRPKCARKTYVGLWGQSSVSIGRQRRTEGPECYKGLHIKAGAFLKEMDAELTRVR